MHKEEIKKIVINPKAYGDNIKDLEDEKQIKITLEDIGGEE